MPANKAIYALFILLAIIFSCKKKATPKPEKPYITDMYAAGFKVVNYQSIGVYWKNGNQVNVTTSGAMSSFNAIAVVDTDVYLAGFSPNGATYWKNAQPYYISPGLSELFAIAISGNDIYLAGRDWQSGAQYGRAALWKNGVETDFTDGSAPAAVNSITFSGADVYTAGFYNQGQNANTSGEAVAACWKNQTLIPLDSAAIAVPGGSTATSITVNGSDVYVAGYIGLTAALWKNGTLQHLDHSNVSPNLSFGFCVVVNDGDVYVSGTDADAAAYWKNGVVKSLISGPTVQSGAQSMCFQGADRYMAGYIGLNGTPTFWKNDTTYTLQNNGEFYNVTGIAVSRHQ